MDFKAVSRVHILNENRKCIQTEEIFITNRYNKYDFIQKILKSGSFYIRLCISDIKDNTSCEYCIEHLEFNKRL